MHKPFVPNYFLTSPATRTLNFNKNKSRIDGYKYVYI